MSNRLKRIIQVALTTMVLAVLLAVSASAATVKATANVPVRAKAKTSSTKLTTMKKNMSRTVISVSSNKKWVKVKVNGKTGYVNTSRVKYVTASAKKTATTVSDETKIKLGKFKLTFYGDDTITASGKKPQINHTIAVDPRVIPLGSKVYIEGMGTYYAEDTGGAIKGSILDVFVRTEAEANRLGIRYADVYLYK